GRAAVIEGFGFGATQGAGGVTLAAAGGGTVAAPVAGASGWSDLAIRVTLPDNAVSGTLTVMTATGLRLTATVHVIPRVPFSRDTLRWTPRSPFPSAPVGVAGPFAPIEPLPAPVAGAAAVVRRGRIYVLGGADSVGHPQRSVFVGRVGLDGHIDGWYRQPLLTSARAYGGGVVLDDRAIAFGGVAD